MVYDGAHKGGGQVRGNCHVSRDEGEWQVAYRGPMQLVEVSGLRSATTYRFRVEAHNEVRSLPAPGLCSQSSYFQPPISEVTRHLL